MRNNLTLAALPLLTACGFPIDFEPFGCNKTNAECRNPGQQSPTEPTEPAEPTIEELLKDEYERGFYSSCRSANGTVLLRDSGAILHCDVPEVQEEPVSCPEPGKGDGGGVDPDAGGNPVQPDEPAKPASPSAGPDKPNQQPGPGKPVPPVRPTQVVPGKGWFDSYSHGGQCYVDTTYDHDVDNLVVQTSRGPLSVREIEALIGPGPGRAGNPQYNDVQCGNGPANSAGDEDQDVCPGRVDMGAAGCFIRGPRFQLPPEAGVLVSIHGDMSGDVDNIQALIANEMIARKLNLNYLTVIGVKGHADSYPFFQESLEIVATLGMSVINANQNRSDAVQQVASAWYQHISNGGTVAVAAGGPMDFTSDVLRRLGGKQRAKVTVYQHSHGQGWNERHTAPANMAFIKNSAKYVRVDNGNVANNGSGDFKQLVPVQARALEADPIFGEAWTLAYTRLPSYGCGAERYGCGNDFSDIVEILAIVGDTKTLDIKGFVSKYGGASQK